MGIAFPLLDLVGLKTDSLGSQMPNENTTLTLIILYALIPVIFKIWVIFQMWHYPFGKNFFTNSSSLGTSTKKGDNNENSKTATVDRSISIISSYKRVQ
ncbi:MAG: hypothetical protein ACI88H_003227 [Cocleimonas sp.]